MIVPVETELTAPYWAAAARGRVLLQRCGSCGQVWHPPAPVCPGCRGTAWEWFEAAGQGAVRSFTEVVHPVHRQVETVVPYLVVLVELAEGPLFLCGWAGERLPADAQEVTISLGTAAGGKPLPTARPS